MWQVLLGGHRVEPELTDRFDPFFDVGARLKVHALPRGSVYPDRPVEGDAPVGAGFNIADYLAVYGYFPFGQ